MIESIDGRPELGGVYRALMGHGMRWGIVGAAVAVVLAALLYVSCSGTTPDAIDTTAQAAARDDAVGQALAGEASTEAAIAGTAGDRIAGAGIAGAGIAGEWRIETA